MKLDFTEKVAVITGGGNGIGRALCLEFARSGARVACVDIDEVQGSETVQMIEGEGGEAIFIRADVSNSGDVQNYVGETLATYGRIHVFVNNAGMEGDVAATVDYPEDVFDQVMAVNVRGVFLGLKYVLPIMQDKGSGAVINMGSTGSHVGAPGVCAYTASKHAVLGLTRTAALEVAKYGIRVNAVCPGGTNTRMLKSLIAARSGHEDMAFNLATPNGRTAEAKEIAAAVLFLASDLASHIVGQYLIIDGGRLAM